MKGWRVPRRSSSRGVKDRNSDRDEDLVLFRELQQRNKDRNIVSLLLPVSDEFEPDGTCIMFVCLFIVFVFQLKSKLLYMYFVFQRRIIENQETMNSTEFHLPRKDRQDLNFLPKTTSATRIGTICILMIYIYIGLVRN